MLNGNRRSSLLLCFQTLLPFFVFQLLQLSTVRSFSIRDFMDHENGVVAVEMLSKDFDPTAVVTEPLPPVVTSTADCDLIGKLAEDHKGTREKQMVLGRNVHTTCLAVTEPEPNDEFTGDKDAYMASVLARYRKTLVERTKHHLGYPYNLDFDYGALAQLQHFSINNLGDPFIESNYGVHSRQFEVGVLDWFARLWEIEKNEYWGYITNCGTEGNLHGVLVGREVCPDGILYASRESHYSIFKAARMYRMECEMIDCLISGEIDCADFKTKLLAHQDKPAIINVNIALIFHRTTFRSFLTISGLMACVKLNDAAFDLSNGRVINECGQELGETLLNLSRAWEQADTSTSHALANKLPGLEDSMTGNAKSAFGKRLVSAGRRFQSMGQYGQGELQKIAKVMITTGRVCALMAVGRRRRVGRLQERRRGGCTRCSRWSAKYFDWQTVGLMHSYRKARQPGPITRLLSCTDDEKKKYKGRHLALTFEVPSISSHPKTGDWYPAINKPAGVVHWLKHSKETENVDWVVILDADMIIHGPIIPWELGAEKGKPVAAYYGQEHWKCHVNSL